MKVMSSSQAGQTPKETWTFQSTSTPRGTLVRAENTKGERVSGMGKTATEAIVDALKRLFQKEDKQ